VFFFFFKFVKKIQVTTVIRINVSLHEDLCTFKTMPCKILLRMRNFWGKSCSKNQNTHFIFNNFLSKNCATYVTMRKNTVESDRPLITT